VPGYLAKGPVTPAGNMQLFKINSLTCWFVNVVCFYVFGVHAQLFDADYPSRNIGAMYNVATLFGICYAIAAYAKGRLAPTNTDAAFRDNWPQDFFLGIELSPRLPFTAATSLIHQLDSKLFTIGHCGMISWTIMNLSHAARMYKDHNGAISMSMILVNVFQAIYTVDWAWKEVWYLYTIDMRHDRLGFYLGWGSLAWLPVMYCIQAWYLSLRAPSDVVLSQTDVAVIVGVFLLGMTLFRLANNQKDEFRAAPSANIWGAKPKYIEAKYSTGDGKMHTSLLLCSGYWGVSRHFNYLSDLFICLSFSLPCRSAVLPYFYLVYMFALLLHRSIRDDRKCRAKYGEDWDKYCERVPYVLVPYVY
jgi:7-dehydrocholesterol reductase